MNYYYICILRMSLTRILVAGQHAKNPLYFDMSATNV